MPAMIGSAGREPSSQRQPLYDRNASHGDGDESGRAHERCAARLDIISSSSSVASENDSLSLLLSF